MGRKPRVAAPPRWQYQRGEPPNTVTAEERVDRGRVVEVRWWVPALKRYRRLSLGVSVRDDRGALVPERQQEAVRRTQAIYDALMAGRDPAVATGTDSAQAAGPLTLAEGFDLATAVPTGMYVVESEHLREVRRAARDVVAAIGTSPQGAARTWDALTYSAVREVWLALARRYAAGEGGGPAWTERCVVVLLQVAQWLAAEEKIERVVPVRRTWREQLRREWEQLTATRIERQTPRHSEDEIRRIFAALDRPDVDPRIALAVELGAEARLGQVRRLTRRNVNLSPVGAYQLGRVTVHGAGKKLGVTRDLTPEERAAIDRALASYLRDLEDADRRGLRDDYPVFPAGRLRYDVAPSRRSRKRGVPRGPEPVRRARADAPDTPIDKRTLTDLFHALEKAAGVTPVPGRGWYGIRRRATDVYEDYETDERVLNDQTGHRHSDTRREVYQERDREAIRAKSAETRRRVRQVAFGRGSPATANPPGESDTRAADGDSVERADIENPQSVREDSA